MPVFILILAGYNFFTARESVLKTNALMDYEYDYLNANCYNNKFGHYKFDREYSFIKKHTPEKVESMLDIAGGSGRFALPLSESVKEMVVVDINEAAIKMLNERNKNIKTICGDFYAIKLDRPFSSIICMEAIGHFEDHDKFLKKIRELLQTNGEFIFTYTNPLSWKSLLRDLYYLGRPSTHFNNMRIKEFRKLLHKNGFEVLEVEGMNWAPLPLGSNSSLVTLFAKLEQAFLKNWLGQSPWLLFATRKV